MAAPPVSNPDARSKSLAHLHGNRLERVLHCVFTGKLV